jgi:TRAP-type C4-dicarboxylate transport system permease small subunit
MRKFLRRQQQVIEGLSFVTGFIAAICILSAALVVTEGVIVRKVFGTSAIWQIEASVYMLIFSCFVGASFVQKEEHHLNVDFVLIHLKPKTREWLLVVVSIIACALAGLLAWYAWPMWWECVLANEHSESLWGPPMWIPYFFLPFGMSLLFFQYIVHIYGKISSLRRGEVGEEADRIDLRDIDLAERNKEP